MGKVPDFLPNKPTVVGSRGQNVGSGYLNRGSSGAGAGVGSPKLPQLSSGGIALNNPSIRKNSGGIRPNQAAMPGQPAGYNRASNNLNVFNKYTSGLGGGIGGGIGGGMGSGIGSSPYNLNYNENRQGEQGSIGTSGSLDKPGSGLGSGKGSTLNLPAVSNNNVGLLKSRGQGTSGGGGALGSSGSQARRSRGPGVSSLTRAPQIGMNANSGAGFSSKSPYGAPPLGSGGAGSNLGKAGASSLNTNVFNIPKYTGLGGGIGGGGYRGGLGGGIGGGLGRSSGIGGADSG